MILTGKKIDKPMHVSHTIDGWTIEADVHYYQNGFDYGFAQDGDPIGSITLCNKQLNMKVKLERVNLENIHARDNVVKVAYKIKTKYQVDIDYKALHELAEPALSRLYGKFGGVYYQ